MVNLATKLLFIVDKHVLSFGDKSEIKPRHVSLQESLFSIAVLVPIENWLHRAVLITKVDSYLAV